MPCSTQRISWAGSGRVGGGRFLLGALAGLLWLSAGPASLSASNTEVQSLHPPGDSHDFLFTQSVDGPAPLTPALGLWVDYANELLVLLEDEVPIGTALGPVLRVDLTGTIGLTRRLSGTVGLSASLFQGSELRDGTLSGVLPLGDLERPPPAQALGDLRLALKHRTLEPLRLASGRQLPGAGGVVDVSLPTAPAGSLTGSGMPTLSLAGMLEQRAAWGRLAVNLGYRWFPRPTRLAEQVIDDTIWLRGGALVELRPGWEVAGEGFLSHRLAGTGAAFAQQSLLEVLISGRRALGGGWSVSVGAGAGLSRSTGTPDLRLGIGLTFFPRPMRDDDGDGVVDAQERCPLELEDLDRFEDEDGCPDLDNDRDGIPDPLDSCPDLPEDPDAFEDTDGCPDPDNDGDGRPDPADACPLEREDADGFADEDGCPEDDNDADGLSDAVDICPMRAEDRDQFQDEDGCPEDDNDGDGISDGLDQCPDHSETYNAHQDEDGCPDASPTFAGLRIEGERVVLDVPLKFKPGSDVLVGEGRELLAPLVSLLQSWPEARVRVEGHTDARGGEAGNLRLSRKRAEAIKRGLTAADPDLEPRVDAVGLGAAVPLLPNDTEEGREANRRIELKLSGHPIPP